MSISTEAEDDSGGETHIILCPCCSSCVARKSGHQVFSLNDADSEVAVHPEVQAAPGGHGKRVLVRKKRAIDSATGEYYLVRVHASKQNLGKGSDPVVLPERIARAEEIREDSHV